MGLLYGVAEKEPEGWVCTHTTWISEDTMQGQIQNVSSPKNSRGVGGGEQGDSSVPPLEGEITLW